MPIKSFYSILKIFDFNFCRFLEIQHFENRPHTNDISGAGEPDTRAVDARAVDTRAAIFQKVDNGAAVSYHINYCKLVWGFGTKTNIESLFRVQKKGMRAVIPGFINTKSYFAKYYILLIQNVIHA